MRMKWGGKKRGVDRERDILINSKLTGHCHEAAGYVEGLVVGKRVSVGVRVRIGVGIGV